MLEGDNLKDSLPCVIFLRITFFPCLLSCHSSLRAILFLSQQNYEYHLRYQTPIGLFRSPDTAFWSYLYIMYIPCKEPQPI